MIIRGEIPHQTLFLTPSGEVYEDVEHGNEEGIFEEEIKKAFQKGYQRGEQCGYEKAYGEIRPLLNLVSKVAEKILDQKERVLEQIKPEVIEFSLCVCERILRQELLSSEALVTLINSLLSRSVGAWQGEMLLIYLSPADLVMLEHHLSKIHYDKREVKGVRFLPDSLIKRGELRIEGGRSLLNFDLTRELNDLKSKVLEA